MNYRRKSRTFLREIAGRQVKEIKEERSPDLKKSTSLGLGGTSREMLAL
jgi:hypothetical protein